jgi:hypothetical protein
MRLGAAPKVIVWAVCVGVPLPPPPQATSRAAARGKMLKDQRTFLFKKIISFS